MEKAHYDAGSLAWLLAARLREGCPTLRDAIGELAELRREARRRGRPPEASLRARGEQLPAEVRRHGSDWCSGPRPAPDAAGLASGAEPGLWLARAVSLWLRFPGSRGELRALRAG